MDTDAPAIISGSTHTVRTLVDGTLTLTLHIEPRHAQAAFLMFGAPGTSVAVAKLVPEAAQKEAQQAVEKENYGGAYQCLFRAGFFYNPAVLDAFGISLDLAAEEKIRSIKEKAYRYFGADSLANIHPDAFYKWIDAKCVAHALPHDFMEWVE